MVVVACCGHKRGAGLSQNNNETRREKPPVVALACMLAATGTPWRTKKERHIRIPKVLTAKLIAAAIAADATSLWLRAVLVARAYETATVD